MLLLQLTEIILSTCVSVTFLVTQVLDSPSVSGQRPGLPLIALTELHHTVLIQLNPGALRVNHLIQTQLYLPPLSHTHTPDTTSIQRSMTD